MIRVWTTVPMLVALLAGGVAQAESRGSGSLGVGLVVGEPTGITGEYYPHSPGFGQALELTIGLDTFDERHLYAHLIWKFYLTQLVRGSSIDVPIYVGIGPWIADGHGPNDSDDIDLGGRMPFGIALDFKAAPLQVFFELALDMEIVDNFDIDVDGAIGFRYYF